MVFEMSSRFLLLVTGLLVVASLPSQVAAFSNPVFLVDEQQSKVVVPYDPSDIQTSIQNSIVVSLASGHGSSLTCSELGVVMRESRTFDFKTKTWSFRPAMVGVKRSAFLDSYTRDRSRIGASLCNLGVEAVSK